ncbi:hypothetical protein CHK_3084 [Christensenella hongkongensis]|uniref:Uncharacterized protein n=1 Tax=Christensenella hongkongensis TaxID=270498 RepID=A0A0M2NEX9_9FIRM|nr:hypothetical protein CHK_3084 [Christensenella hongkongensis]
MFIITLDILPQIDFVYNKEGKNPLRRAGTDGNLTKKQMIAILGFGIEYFGR